eukprot:jgi/Chlat1/8451/Chrsp80S00649
MSAGLEASLWWPPHRLLYETLERADLGQCPADELAERLKQHEEWLLRTLSMFRSPSATSKAALSQSSISLGSHTISVQPKLRDIALRVSAVLNLDEVQSYILLERFVEEQKLDARSLDAPDLGLFVKIVVYHFTERARLLNCLHTLLRICEAREETQPYFKAACDCVERLITKGLEDQLCTQLRNIFQSPVDVSLPGTEIACEEQSMLEQSLLLEILALLYYRREYVLSKHIELQTSMRRRATEPSLSSVQALSVILLVEVLDLDRLLDMVRQGSLLRDGEHPFTSDDVIKIDELFSSWSVTPALAPVLLAWAVFLSLASSLQPPPSVAQMAGRHRQYVAVAYSAGAFTFLANVLQMDMLHSNEPHVTGYKSILKNLLSSFFAAYDVGTQQLGKEDLETFTVILSEVFQGQQELCSQFWNDDDDFDIPLRRFLDVLRALFPYQLLPLMRVLSALSEGSFSAQHVVNYLQRTPTLTWQHSVSDRSVEVHDSGRVHAKQDILAIMRIPAGTTGEVLESPLVDDGSVLVRWQFPYNALQLLCQWLSSTIQLISDPRTPRATRHQLLAAVQVVLELHVMLLAADKHILTWFCSCQPDIFSVAIELLQALTELQAPPPAIVGLCIALAKAQARRHARSVIQQLEILMPRLMSRAEHMLLGATSNHAAAIAFLELTCFLLSRGGYCALVVREMAQFAVEMVFPEHAAWPYANPAERWQITALCLQIMRLGADTSLPYATSTLKDAILDVVLYHGPVIAAFLQVITIDWATLHDRLEYSGLHQAEFLCMERAIAHALATLQVLLLQAFRHDKHMSAPTPLEQAIFTHKSSSKAAMTAVAAVASYVGNSHSMDLPVLAAKALASITMSATKFRPSPIPIPAYLSNSHVLLEAFTLYAKQPQLLHPDALLQELLDLAVVAAEWQPMFANWLMSPRDKDGKLMPAKQSDTTQRSGLLDLVRIVLDSSATLFREQPRVLSRVSSLLHAAWQPDCVEALNALKADECFWEKLGACLYIPTADPASDSTACAWQTAAQASVLSICALELFSASLSAVQSDKKPDCHKGPGQLLLDWNKRAQTPATHAISKCFEFAYDPDAVQHLNVETAAFVLHVAAQEVCEDRDDGVPLDVSQAAKQVVEESVLQHPSWLSTASELAARHAGRESLSQSAALELLAQQLANDSVAVVAQPVVNSLLSRNVHDMVLARVRRVLEEFGDSYLYDARWLAEAGVWDRSAEHVDAATRVNHMLSVAAAQVQLLEAWGTVLTPAVYSLRYEVWCPPLLDTWTAEDAVELLNQSTTHLARTLVLTAACPSAYATTYLEHASFLQLVLANLWLVLPGATLPSTHASYVLNLLRATSACLHSLSVGAAASLPSSVETSAPLLHLLMLLLRHAEQSSWQEDISFVAGFMQLAFDLIPILCNCIRHEKLTEIALACLSHLMECYADAAILGLEAVAELAEAIFHHFNVEELFSKIQPASDQIYIKALLSWCLSIARFPTAAVSLESQGFTRHATTLGKAILQLESASPARDSLEETRRTREVQRNWCTLLSTLSEVVRALGDDSLEMDPVFTFLEIFQDRMLAALHPPAAHPMQQFTMRPLLVQLAQPLRLTLGFLVEAERTLFMLCQLVPHLSQWQFNLPRSRPLYQQAVVHLVALVARPPHHLHVQAVTPEERAATQRESFGLSAHGWFEYAARASATDLKPSSSNVATTASSGDRQLALRTPPPSSRDSRGKPSAFSDRAAVRVYSCTEKAMRYLVASCMHEVDEWMDAAAPLVESFAGLELPSLEVLSALQEQVLTVLADVCIASPPTKDQLPLDELREQIISIVRDSLYLQLCVGRVRGLWPSQLHTSTFQSAFHKALSAMQQRPQLQEQAQELKAMANALFMNLTRTLL